MTQNQPPINPARLALVVALLLLVSSGDPNPTHIAVYLAIAVVLLVSTRWPIELLTIGLLLVAAIVVRLAWSDKSGSDVLTVTKVAIDRMLAGLNPYGYAYQSSSPPGAPFPYGPLALILYLPFHNVAWLLELLTAFAVAAILAFEGRMIGLAAFGLAPAIVQTSVDGSNDTTLGLIILIAFIAARRSPLAGAVGLAAAVAFKLSALAFVPGFFVWAGLRASLLFVASSVITWAPVLATYGIGSFIESARMADGINKATRWSFGVLVKELAGRRIDILDQLRYVAGGLVVLVGLRFRRSLDDVIIVGTIAYLVTLFGGNWGSYAYLGGIFPLLCWRLDDWLGFESRSLRDRVRALRPAAATPVAAA